MSKWIIVADSSRARLFSYHGLKSPLKEFDDLAHTASRMHEGELTSDLPGRSFDSTGHNRHALEQKSTVKDQEAHLFAAQVAAAGTDVVAAARIARPRRAPHSRQPGARHEPVRFRGRLFEHL